MEEVGPAIQQSNPPPLPKKLIEQEREMTIIEIKMETREVVEGNGQGYRVMLVLRWERRFLTSMLGVFLLPLEKKRESELKLACKPHSVSPAMPDPWSW